MDDTQNVNSNNAFFSTGYGASTILLISQIILGILSVVHMRGFSLNGILSEVGHPTTRIEWCTVIDDFVFKSPEVYSQVSSFQTISWPVLLSRQVSRLD